MNDFLTIHPENPQSRFLNQAADIVRRGGIIAYPTDSGYALGCHIGDKNALERIRAIRKLDAKHNFTLVCRDLSELAVYAKVDNVAYRILRSHTPGPYTFVLQASSEVPRRLKHPKRKTIGIRVPDNLIAQGLLAALDEPLMSVTLIMPGESLPLLDPYEIRDLLGHQLELVIDGGFCGMDPTSVVDLSTETVEVLREGAGCVAEFQ
ncbi:L-threonylcarbamoyladenylate synthase [Pseudomonadales bacterium]|nr:L-threonylcarbamoyladenylate synthase [Pseudomonadales bacterium]MDB4451357.1 L-threonylcarbamoyladenylate synthase [Pseudomonadales bacterium]MDB4542209.1 L-threonylcarbamoyladenylate synthase [Pseudomonadales bacterium]